jgi:hypothetical protein
VYMSNMDVGSSLRCLSASTVTYSHHFDSTTTSDPEPQNLSLLLWVKLGKNAAVCLCLWTAYQCAQTLFICLIWMWEAV